MSVGSGSDEKEVNGAELFLEGCKSLLKLKIIN